VFHCSCYNTVTVDCSTSTIEKALMPNYTGILYSDLSALLLIVFSALCYICMLLYNLQILFHLLKLNFCLFVANKTSNLFDAISFSLTIKLWNQQSHGRKEGVHLKSQSYTNIIKLTAAKL